MTAPAPVPTLEAAGVTRRYAGLTAVDAVDLTLRGGEVVALIGPNGAGKTTLFAVLSGAERPDDGRVLLDGEDVTGLPADALARRGLARTFQRLAVFGSLTVRDNLLTGAESRRPGSLLRGLLGRPDRAVGAAVPGGAARDSDLARVHEVAGTLGLAEHLDRPAGTLSTGGQRLVELGRALCRDPRLLLLDEPASGLDTAETEALQQVLRAVAAAGIGVLLVEHDVGLVLRTADRVYAMSSGRVLREGTPAEVAADPDVRAVYLPAGGR